MKSFAEVSNLFSFILMYSANKFQKLFTVNLIYFNEIETFQVLQCTKIEVFHLAEFF